MTTKKQGHTPTPWKSELEVDGSFWIMSDALIVARVEPREEARANAKLIAMACSNHAKLVEALKATKKLLNKPDAVVWSDIETIVDDALKSMEAL